MIECGRVAGTVLYVYGRVTAVGREMKGETVRGTWASRGCDSATSLAFQFGSVAGRSYYEIRT